MAHFLCCHLTKKGDINLEKLLRNLCLTGDIDNEADEFKTKTNQKSSQNRQELSEIS